MKRKEAAGKVGLNRSLVPVQVGRGLIQKHSSPIWIDFQTETECSLPRQRRNDDGTIPE